MNNMKKFPILSLLFFVCIFSCGKENVFDKYGTYGEGSALLNGISYTGTVGTLVSFNICKPDTCIGINILHQNKYGEARETITFSIVPLKVGKFLIPYSIPGELDYSNYRFSYSRFAEDGDVIAGFYKTYQPDTANWVNFKKLDLKTGDFEATFQATVVSAENFTPLGAIPDTIRITNGKFFGKINWNYFK